MRKFISVLLAGVLAIVMVGCGNNSSGGGIEGNGGSAVSDGKMVYYMDNNQIRRLAVDKLDGESELIYEGEVGNLNLSEDGKIYFASDDGISWIKPEEKDATDLIKQEGLQPRNLVINGEWLYFCRDFEGSYPIGIYRINVNSSAVETVTDGSSRGAGSFGFCLAGNAIYYLERGNDEYWYGLMKKDIISGTSSLVINFGKSEEDGYAIKFYVTDEYIYCTTSNGTVIKRFDLDGKNEKIIYTAKDDQTAGVVFADKDFVYFESKESETAYYRVKTDGTGFEQIANEWEKFPEPAFVAEKIFARHYGEEDDFNARIYCVDRDGKNGFRLK